MMAGALQASNGDGAGDKWRRDLARHETAAAAAVARIADKRRPNATRPRLATGRGDDAVKRYGEWRAIGGGPESGKVAGRKIGASWRNVGRTS